MKYMIAFLLLIATCEATCISNSGSVVDWYITLKSPKDSLQYLYYDSKDSFNVNMKPNAIENTLNQVYENRKDLYNYLWAGYNDEWPSGEVSYEYGHSKGFIWSNSKSGFWLIHSVPKGFNMTAPFQYPVNALEYGQSFLCISMNFNDMDTVAIYMKTANVWLYDVNFPSKWGSKLPIMNSILTKSTQKKLDSPTKVELFTSLGGQKFTAFSKSKLVKMDLYAGLVAPILESSLYVESWMRPSLESFCNGTYQVIDITAIEWPNSTIRYLESNDHSKWAISVDSRVANVCIGDMNHQISQESRSGGTVCLQYPHLYKLFSSLVVSKNDC